MLARIEEMRDHCTVASTASGGPHTLWVLGHLAYVEHLVVQRLMMGKPNPLAHWEPLFDGEEVSGAHGHYPPFDQVLATCREARDLTLATLDALSEHALDNVSAVVPTGFEETFASYRDCLQYVADHWYMHRGHLADARRAAGVRRIWV